MMLYFNQSLLLLEMILLLQIVRARPILIRNSFNNIYIKRFLSSQLVVRFELAYVIRKYLDSSLSHFIFSPPFLRGIYTNVERKINYRCFLYLSHLMIKPYRSIEFDGATGLARKMNRSLDGDGATQRGTGRALS